MSFKAKVGLRVLGRTRLRRRVCSAAVTRVVNSAHQDCSHKDLLYAARPMLEWGQLAFVTERPGLLVSGCLSIGGTCARSYIRHVLKLPNEMLSAAKAQAHAGCQLSPSDPELQPAPWSVLVLALFNCRFSMPCKMLAANGCAGHEMRAHAYLKHIGNTALCAEVCMLAQASKVRARQAASSIWAMVKMATKTRRQVRPCSPAVGLLLGCHSAMLLSSIDRIVLGSLWQVLSSQQLIQSLCDDNHDSTPEQSMYLYMTSTGNT